MSTAAASANVALVDTNVHLFEWPFRRLPYDRTNALVAKLRRHGVQEAWAGSFEALLSKDLSGVNERLVEACRREGAGLFVPFGSVNPLWPDWEEELRRCDEAHHMGGIRLYPGYHGYTLDHPDFGRLLELATRRRLVVQLALELEDTRVQHPLIKAPVVSPAPLVAALKNVPGARIQLLNSWQWVRSAAAKPLLQMENVVHDISNLEASGAVGRIIAGQHPLLSAKMPVERLLFGSQAPYFPVEAALIKLFESPLSLPQLNAIMSDNARRLIAKT